MIEELLEGVEDSIKKLISDAYVLGMAKMIRYHPGYQDIATYQPVPITGEPCREYELGGFK